MSGEGMEMKHRMSGEQNGSIAAKEPPGVETMQLKKRVGLFSGVALIVGTMIGSGIFVSPKGVLREVGGVGPSLLVWTGCGVISMMGALTYAELGTMITESGGEYAYLFKAFGPIPAFLFQWTNVILLKPSSLSAIALSFAIYVGQPFYPACVVPDAVVKFLAAVCIVLVTALNCISVKVAARIQVFFTAIKVLALGVIIGVGIYSLAIGNTTWLSPDKAFQTGHTITISDIGLAFYQGLWAYDGWNNLNFVTEEIENPVRNLPLAIMISIPLVTLLYVLANVAYFSVMTPSELLASGAVAVTLGNRFLGVMSWVVPFAVVCSTFGACNGSCFAASRQVISDRFLTSRVRTVKASASTFSCFFYFDTQTLGNRYLGVMAWIIPFSVACSTFGACNGSAFSGARRVLGRKERKTVLIYSPSKSLICHPF
ncbi:b(0,+)-type amino acid transporter 1-like isoform X5 [Branchiostoma floridae x Branchiostoma japonicum]